MSNNTVGFIDNINLETDDENQIKLQKVIDKQRGKSININPLIEKITSTTARVLSDNYKTKVNQFRFSDGKPVPANKYYHIHYTLDLQEYYMTELKHTPNSKIIYPINQKSDFSMYNSLNKQSVLTILPTKPMPTEKDYDAGFIKRFFAKKANDLQSPILEISPAQFNKSPLYVYAKTNWLIRGKIDYVKRYNFLATKRVSVIIPSLKKYLSPFQMYRSEASDDIKQNIMDRLSVGSDLTNASTQTMSNQSTGAGAASGPPPGVTTGGAGGY